MKYSGRHRPSYSLDTIATLCAECDDYWPCRYAEECHTSPGVEPPPQDAHNESAPVQFMHGCPNQPPCAHPFYDHDIDSWDDPWPTCCVAECACGQPTSDARAEAEVERLSGAIHDLIAAQPPGYEERVDREALLADFLRLRSDCRSCGTHIGPGTNRADVDGECFACAITASPTPEQSE